MVAQKVELFPIVATAQNRAPDNAIFLSENQKIHEKNENTYYKLKLLNLDLCTKKFFPREEE